MKVVLFRSDGWTPRPNCNSKQWTYKVSSQHNFELTKKILGWPHILSLIVLACHFCHSMKTTVNARVFKDLSLTDSIFTWTRIQFLVKGSYNQLVGLFLCLLNKAHLQLGALNHILVVAFLSLL